ncbi:MAG: hypothetical protein R3E96_09110 [Planctomycetota bacterium]
MSGIEIETLVRFGDVDAAGIAYFPSIYNMIHSAFEDLLGGTPGGLPAPT